jgi:GNAT superfamily N-acetyltransferase
MPISIFCFQKFAVQNQFRLHIGTTYVAVVERDILGFVTLAATSITIDSLPMRQRTRLPRYPLPALRIARLAVAESAQGQGLGKQLLRASFQIAREMPNRVGCVGALVDAKPEAIPFYEQYGFEPIRI